MHVSKQMESTTMQSGFHFSNVERKMWSTHFFTHGHTPGCDDDIGTTYALVQGVQQVVWAAMEFEMALINKLLSGQWSQLN